MLNTLYKHEGHISDTKNYLPREWNYLQVELRSTINNIFPSIEGVLFHLVSSDGETIGIELINLQHLSIVQKLVEKHV